MYMVREVEKKLFDVGAEPLREGGGVRAWPTKKNNFFLKCWQNRCFLTSLLQYLAKYMFFLVQKCCGGFWSEFVSGYFKTKKM